MECYEGKKKKKRQDRYGKNILLDTVEGELGKLTALKSSRLARPLEDKVSVNVKHTNTRVNGELFGVGVILWNTISLSNLLRLRSSVCQYQESMWSVQRVPRAVCQSRPEMCEKYFSCLVLYRESELIRE